MNLSGGDPESASNDCGAAGFVLAGGLSSRMGGDKALVHLAGEPLIAHALRTLREAGLSSAIAGARSALSKFAPVVPDPTPGLGPLSGICAGLASTSTRYAVFLPVDLPFAPPSLIAFLLRHASVTGRAVTVPSASGFDQTFPAVLERSVLHTLQSELAAGHGGCFQAFHVAARVSGEPIGRVSVELLTQSGQVAHPRALPSYQWFLNVNTPSDVERAESICRRRIA